jgi:poly(3-hydroxybutyrate) depolymerase
MGSAYPGLYAAICVHSGLACRAAKDLPSAFAAMRQGGTLLPEGARRPLPTIVFHGDRDNTVSPLNGDQVIAHQRRERSCT